jgi:hypothetical protein
MVPGESKRPVRSLYTDLVSQYDDACPGSYCFLSIKYSGMLAFEVRALSPG